MQKIAEKTQHVNIRYEMVNLLMKLYVFMIGFVTHEFLVCFFLKCQSWVT